MAMSAKQTTVVNDIQNWTTEKLNATK